MRAVQCAVNFSLSRGQSPLGLEASRDAERAAGKQDSALRSQQFHLKSDFRSHVS